MQSPLYEIMPNGVPQASVDTAAFFVMPFGGDIGNTGDRLQAAANESGIAIYATDLLGQSSRTIFDMAARTALRPGADFADTCKRYADAVAELPYLNDYQHNLGIGHSLGGVAIAGMHHYGHGQEQIPSPWDAIELADSVNLRAPEGPGAYLRFAAYQMTDAVRQAVVSGSQRRPATELPAYDASKYPQVENPPSAVAKFRAIGPLMRSTESALCTLAVADDPSMPLHFVGYYGGLSGPEGELNSFVDTIARRRRAAVQGLNRPVALVKTNDQELRLVFSLEDSWHSDLLDPRRTAGQLVLTRRLAQESTALQ